MRARSGAAPGGRSVSADARSSAIARQPRSRGRAPVAAWLRSYRAAWLAPDLLAGVTLAAYAIPVSLAYSTLAGLPPESGLYCYLAGGLAFALLGTSRQVAFGPTSSIAILLGSTLATLAHG